MKQKKAREERPTSGTVIAAKYRAQCNLLTDTERSKLSEEFLKLYYGSHSNQPARRR